jgi:hypothetical protein
LYFKKSFDESLGVDFIDRDFKGYYRGQTVKNDLDSFFKIEIEHP